jgi:hypothetical protein
MCYVNVDTPQHKYQRTPAAMLDVRVHKQGRKLLETSGANLNTLSHMYQCTHNYLLHPACSRTAVSCSRCAASTSTRCGSYVRDPAPTHVQPTYKSRVQKKGRELLETSGVDVDTLSRTAGSAESQLSGVAKTATPTLNKVYNFLTTSDPQTLGKTAVVAILAWYLTPVAIRGVFSSLRGYSGAPLRLRTACDVHVWIIVTSRTSRDVVRLTALDRSVELLPSSPHGARASAGDVTPAKAVDIVGSDGGACLVDLRSTREKEATGVPDVPSSAKGRFIELEAAQIERRLRGQLRNVDAVEAQARCAQACCARWRRPCRVASMTRACDKLCVQRSWPHMTIRLPMPGS